MCKKKLITAILVTTMVMGSTLTAFAAGEDETTTPAKNGGTSGAGSSEGHVDKEVESMLLPTVPEDNATSPFKYTMDPERLIQETTGGKYEEGTTFPAKESDTGVYFLTGDKTYANTSKTLQAVNNGSCDVTLTVTAKTTASAGGKDIALATSSTVATTGAPNLYLGLAVGKEAPTALKADAQTITRTIAGTPGNFEITLDENNKYVYKEKADATTWKAIDISLTGAVSKGLAIAEDTTAPTVDVTWSYAKAAEDAAVDTADQVDYTTTPPVVDADPAISSITEFTKSSPEDVVISFTLGSGEKAVEADGATLAQGANKSAVNASRYRVDMTAKTITIDKSAGFVANATDDVPVCVTLTKGGTMVKELSGTITVK